MDISQDYDDDGNNIVPCPICLDVYCKSKDGGKCLREDEFVRDMSMNPHTKQQLEAIYRPTEKNLNDFRNGRIGYEGFIAKQEDLLKQALKSQAEYIRAKMVPSICTNRTDCYAEGKNACIDEISTKLDELINSFK